MSDHSRPLTLAYVHREFPSIGGLEKLILGLLAQHDRANVIPKIALLGEGPLRACLPPSIECAFLAGPRFRDIRANVAVLMRLAAVLRRWRADVVLCNGFGSAPWAGAVAALLRIPHVLYVHEIIDGRPADLGLRLGLNLPAALVLANSGASHDALVAYYGGRRVVRTLLPGTDVARFASGGARAAELRQRIGVPSDALMVTVPGRLQRWKGQAFFAQAARQLERSFPSAHFVMAGAPSVDADIPYARELEAMTTAHLHLCGFIDDVPALLAASDVVVCSSAAPEPFGLVVIEAMAAGRPVIATNAGGPAEVVLDGETGLLVAPASVEALASAMYQLLASPELRHRLGRRGGELARRFDISETTRTLEACVAGVARRPH